MSSTHASFEESKELFSKLYDSISNDEVPLFERFVLQSFHERRQGKSKEEKVIPKQPNDTKSETVKSNPTPTVGKSETSDTITKIIKELRAAVPPTAEAPGEKVVIPKTPDFEGYNQHNTVHVDSFLYPEEEDVDALCDEGVMSRYYCTKCNSREVDSLNFISHSASLRQLEFIFSKNILGDLTGKTVVDVGSRLGAVLYVAYLNSNASQLIGIEKTKWFVDLQNRFLKKYNMTDRAQVICDDVMNQLDTLYKADVVIMNNVFEFFVSNKKLHTQLWSFMRKAISKKGCKIVTIPAIEQSLESAEIELDVQNWVKPINLEYPDIDDEELLEDYQMIYMYEVK